METFKKREKEMRRLERQRDKAAKRKEIKVRARPPESQVSQIAILKQPKTLRHLTQQQIYRS